MESIFNIFGSQQEAVKLQKPVSSSGTFLDVGPVKPRIKSDSSNVYSKKVLGDIRNTLQQTNKRVDSKENGPIKGKTGEDFAFAGCSRTPLLTKSQGVSKTVRKVVEKSTLKNQTQMPMKLLEVPKTVNKHPNLKTKGNSPFKSGTPSLKTSKFSPIFRDMVSGSPELQGRNPVTEDNYEDIWPPSERPSLRDYGRIMNFWDDNKQSSMVESPQIPELLEDKSLDTNVDSFSNLAKCCETEVSSADPVEEFFEPEIQGPAPFIEDSGEDIWPVSERPVLDDYKRIMVFWDSSKQPAELEQFSVPEPVEDRTIDLDINLVLPPVEELDMIVMDVPHPAVEMD